MHLSIFSSVFLYLSFLLRLSYNITNLSTYYCIRSSHNTTVSTYFFWFFSLIDTTKHPFLILSSLVILLVNFSNHISANFIVRSVFFSISHHSNPYPPTVYPIFHVLLRPTTCLCSLIPNN